MKFRKHNAMRELIAKYPQGTRIKIKGHRKKLSDPKEICGTVTHVDNGCWIYIKLDNGRNIGIREDYNCFEIIN